MIVADRKKVGEIRDMIQDHRRVLLVGCGTCVTVCLAGGERETGILGSALRMALKLSGRGGMVVDECTIERQCEDAFIDVLAARAADWLRSAGVSIPEKQDGSPDCLIEISPNFALDQNDIKQKLNQIPKITPNCKIYLT